MTTEREQRRRALQAKQAHIDAIETRNQAKAYYQEEVLPGIDDKLADIDEQIASLNRTLDIVSKHIDSANIRNQRAKRAKKIRRYKALMQERSVLYSRRQSVVASKREVLSELARLKQLVDQTAYDHAWERHELERLTGGVYDQRECTPAELTRLLVELKDIDDVNEAIAFVKNDGTHHVFWGGIDHARGKGHGHAVLDDRLQIVYRRLPKPIN